MIAKILAIDDDPKYLISIKKLLEIKGYSVTALSNQSEILDALNQLTYDCVLLDVKMPGLNGIELFHIITKKDPYMPVIMISGQSNINIAVDMIKKGAFDFIEKPIETERLLVTIKNALNKRALQAENDIIFDELKENYRMIGQSVQFKELIKNISSLAPTNAKVLIEGESGTGKELIAWAIHHNSKRRGKPYIKVNCASIPSELLESELFGHKKGSFTGADKDREGKFMSADEGTLFLDEIGDMNINLQAKLLRVLEENEIEVIGENIPRKVDVRIVAATNRNLDELVGGKEFREDLYHRLNVIKIQVPPLRERREDILPLAYHFLNYFSVQYNKVVDKFCQQAEAKLINHNWYGNVRELKNIVEKLVIFCKEKEIRLDETISALNKKPIGFFDSVETHPLKIAKTNFEKEYIMETLIKNDWKINETAAVLGIDRTNLFKKMQKLGIDREDV